MSFKTYFLSESLDDPYRYKNTFSTELVEVEDEDGNPQQEEKLTPVQIIRFTTDNGIPYLWYARQSKFNENAWEIAFGVETGVDYKGDTKLDIELTNTRDAFRVFATVIQILNDFIEFDESYEVQILTFTSTGENRTRLYKKRFIPKIKHFEVDFEKTTGDETHFTLSRIS